MMARSFLRVCPLFLFALMFIGEVSLGARIKDVTNLADEKCQDIDITVEQGQLPGGGIPAFTVEIINTCMNPNCMPWNVHLHCGMFESARLVNPALFKRVSDDDCIVNGGKPLKPGMAISFTYANTFTHFPTSLPIFARDSVDR